MRISDWSSDVCSSDLFGAFLIGVPAILIWSWAKGSKVEFQMMVVEMVLINFNVVFWTLFEQAGSSLTLFADRNNELSVFGLFTLSAPQTQHFHPLRTEARRVGKKCVSSCTSRVAP